MPFWITAIFATLGSVYITAFESLLAWGFAELFLRSSNFSYGGLLLIGLFCINFIFSYIKIKKITKI